MAVNFITQLLTGIILASFFQVVFLNENDGCPAIKVKKDQIIRTKRALNEGAEYLHKEDVQSARECYKLCCRRDNCNLGMLRYKNDSNGQLVRTCFLFNCGSPSKCTYAPYKHYATITFEDRKKTEPKQSEDDYSQSKSSEQRWDKVDCPPRAPVALCSSNPCDRATCLRHPWAVCRPSTCGTCHAEFFNADGQRVNCYAYSKPSHSSGDKWNEMNILKKAENLHQSNQAANSNKNQNLETRLQDYTKQNPSSHGSSSNGIEKPEPEEQTDPPFHQWRQFVDNNPKFGKPELVTEKPTEKPTTFHKWREFIDNNPKYAKHTSKKKITVITIPATKPTRKPTKPHVIPKTKPVTAEHPLTESPPKVDDENRKRGNISDVVVIETSSLRIVENKAVVPLAIFLVVALVMLFVVVLRLRVMKTRIRRKAFATDDADYLINGMYL